jgi:pilus assembly protein CpaB
MQQRSLIVLVIGIVIALGTAFSIKSRMGNQAQSGPELSQVMVAVADIPAGAFVRSDVHIAFADWPKGNITESMLTHGTTNLGDFSGAVARRAIQKGEPILKNLLIRSSEGGFMSAVLEPGARAVSIAVDSTSGNAGFIFPGDRVDLILTHAVTRQSIQSRASETFVENVRVLAVDQMIDNPDNKAVIAKTVTLEVTPKQAEEINLAKDLGKISLSLRSLSSKKEGDVAVPEKVDLGQEPQSLEDVLRAQSEQAQEHTGGPSPNMTRDTEVSKIISPEDAAGSQVTIIRGTERSHIQFGPAGDTRAQ